MPAKTSYTPGTPSWVDLASSDLAGSVAFYTELFGWTAHDAGPEAGNYHVFHLGEAQVAGAAGLMSEGQPAAWSCYVSTDDAEKTAERVTTAGGQVLMPPMDVMDIGRMAVFADPTGAAFSVWQPAKHIGAELVGEPGTFCWAELSSRDVPAATGFYPDVFDWTAAPAADGSYTEWHLAGESIAGMMPMPDMVPAGVPSFWLPYFQVADTDATIAKATGLGASVLTGPIDIPPGRFAVLRDPQGVTFAVIRLAQQG